MFRNLAPAPVSGKVTTVLASVDLCSMVCVSLNSLCVAVSVSFIFNCESGKDSQEDLDGFERQ